MKTYLRIFSFAGNLRLRTPLYVLLTVLAILFNLANFSFMVPILNVIFDNAESNLAPAQITELPPFEVSKVYFDALGSYVRGFLMNGSTDKMVLISRICILLVISVFLANLFAFLANATLNHVKKNVIRNIRKDIYKKITDLHLSFFSNERKGDLMSRMTNDIQEIESTAVSSFNILIKEPLTVIIIFIFLFFMHWQLTLFTLIILPLSGIIIGIITKKLRKKAKQGQSSLGKILGIIDETIGGLRIIKAFNAENSQIAKFNKLNLRYTNILYSMDTKRAMASPTSQFLGVSVVALFLYKGSSYIFQQDISLKLEPELFLLFIIFYAQVIAPLKSISNAFSIIQRGLIAADRVFSVLDTKNSIQNKPEALEKADFKQQLELRNVRFKYEEEWVLKGINLSIEKGTTVALVGPSGGGKSTLMDLFPRFHDPVEGQVLIDDTDIRDCTLHSLRNHMGVVTQESILFNDSVFNNIAFGISATKEEVINAAKVANAHEFIDKLENGYDTEIGDRGTKLSGGQRQRLTIARAILKNPAILLLDEATSALDSESEMLVQEALASLMKNRTSIVIAHRLSTIQHADVIVVIKEGEIVEQGSHQDLLEKDGLYKKLSQMQSV